MHIPWFTISLSKFEVTRKHVDVGCSGSNSPRSCSGFAISCLISKALRPIEPLKLKLKRRSLKVKAKHLVCSLFDVWIVCQTPLISVRVDTFSKCDVSVSTSCVVQN
jgi:hypothetical protein